MVNLRAHFGGLGNRLFQLFHIYQEARRAKIPDIYIQNVDLTSPYLQEFRTILRQNLKPVDMVSVHVRRGDYLGNPFYVNLAETDYYDKALQQFPEGTRFLVFCADRQMGSDDENDMQWCQEHFKGKDFQFYQGKDEEEDWNMMASCSAHIIANSSFSWWAATASGNKTVAPTRWFTEQMVATPPPLQDSWIKI